MSSLDQAQRAFILFLFDSDALASSSLACGGEKLSFLVKSSKEVIVALEAWHPQKTSSSQRCLFYFDSLHIPSGIVRRYHYILCCLDRLYDVVSKCQWYHRAMNCTPISSAVALPTTASIWSSSLSSLRNCVGSDNSMTCDERTSTLCPECLLGHRELRMLTTVVRQDQEDKDTGPR